MPTFTPAVFKALCCSRRAIIAGMLSLLPAAAGAIPAFPGAEGYGAVTPGGRGGQVILVTNTNATGAGSFRQALLTPGPRTIVFRVSGVITLTSEIYLEAENLSYLTVAGQTSPGGITITMANGTPIWQYQSNKYHDGIWRFMRFRIVRTSGGNGGDQSFEHYRSHNFIIDHCDFSGGDDEAFDLGDCHDLTVQWSTVTNSGPGGQLYGCLMSSYTPGAQYNITWHHNFFAHHVKRGPEIHWSSNPVPNNGMIDFRNNVDYNFSTHMVRIEPTNTTTLAHVNIVGNYFKEGLDRDGYLYGPVRFTNYVRYYLDQNTYDIARSNWDGGLALCPDTIVDRRFGSNPTRVNTPFAMAQVTTTGSLEARDAVLARVGAWPRDSMNARTLRDFNARAGRLGQSAEPLLTATPPPPADADLDGMPDSFEVAKGLNPNGAADNILDRNGDGYTNIEEYINDLAFVRMGLTPPNSAVERVAARAAEFSVTPNPVRGRATVGAGAAVYNLQGRLLFRAGRDGIWDARGVSPGLYLVRTLAGGKTLTARAVVAK